MSVRRIVILIATLAAASLGLVSVPHARAEVDVNLFLGAPVGFWPGWRPGRWISCDQGARLVYSRGFHRVRTVDCNRPIFRYEARRAGDWWLVRVDGRRGRIMSAQPI